MANTNITSDIITNEGLAILHNSLVFCRSVNRQYDNSNEINGLKTGGPIKVRLPSKYVSVTGAALSANDNVTQFAQLPDSTQRHVDLNFTSQELTQDISMFSENHIRPSMTTLASALDQDAMSMYQQVGNSVGTPGTTPATALVLLQAHQKINEFAGGQMRYACVDPAANAALVNGLSGLFNAQNNIAENYRSGMIASNTLGFREIAMTQSVNTHTTGTFAGTTLVDDTVAEGDSTINIDGFTAAAPAIAAGDVFTIAGVFAVNPETKQSTGSLQQFVVLTAATGASNQVDLTVSPSFYAGSGGLQNISALPADNAAVTFLGTEATTYPQNLAFDRDAFILATTDLEMPDGSVDFAARAVQDGISMRVVRQFRIGTDDQPCRVDILYNYVCTKRGDACRIWG